MPFADLTYADVEALRAAAERHYALMPIVPEIAFTPANAADVPGPVASPAEPGRAWVVLLHGGTYTSGSASGFRSLASALADAVHGRVLAPSRRIVSPFT